LPVKLDKLAVHRLDRALAGSGNQLDDFTESGVGDGVLAHVGSSSLWSILPQAAAKLLVALISSAP
jgi:hypothetical protein